MSLIEKSPGGLPRKSLVREVAPAAAWVAQQAEHVKINAGKIPAYCRTILSKYSLVTHLPRDHHFISDDKEETAAYILALDSINFGSGYFQDGLDYEAVAGGLKKAFEQGELNRPEQWLKVTPEYFSRLMGVPAGELMTLFAKHLQETGKIILADYQGRVLALLERADYSALKLADIVATWDSFRDISTYKGREIPLLKRAQIVAADMQLALLGFRDMDALTIFADNMVPHVLRCDGILSYDAGLATKIDSGAYIPSGSAEEVEIRACAIHAVELMRQEIGRQGPSITAVNLDHLLWHRGHEPEFQLKPAHRTLTTNY